MKIEHILFPVDFSDQSRAMNTEVEWVASRFNARVTLLHVFEVPVGWYGAGEPPIITHNDWIAFQAAEEKRLAEYTLQVPEHKLARVCLEGNAALQIVEYSDKNNVDLIVMSTHGYGPFHRLLLGSVAMKVLHDSDCRVWSHAPMRDAFHIQPGVSSILCSIGPWDDVVPLLRSVKDLANEFGAEVHLVHCVPEMESRPAKYFDYDLHTFQKTSAKNEIAKFQVEAETDFPLHVREGSIAHDIVELAADLHSNLIVIGRGKAQEKFGTVRTHAYEILRQARCPVLSFAGDLHGQSASIRSARQLHAAIAG